MKCQNGGINRFQLYSPPNNSTGVYYEYNCTYGGDFGEQTPNKTTTPTTIGIGQTPILYYTTNLNCGQTSILSRLTYTGASSTSKLSIGALNNDKINIEYNCKPSNTPLICRSVSTPKVSIDPSDTISSLKNLNVYCNYDEAISDVNFMVDQTNKVYYNYNCCSPKPRFSYVTCIDGSTTIQESSIVKKLGTNIKNLDECYNLLKNDSNANTFNYFSIKNNKDCYAYKENTLFDPYIVNQKPQSECQYHCSSTDITRSPYCSNNTSNVVYKLNPF